MYYYGYSGGYGYNNPCCGGNQGGYVYPVNAKYLLDFLANIKNNVIIKATNSSSKFVISEYKNDSYLYVLMPLALREE